MEYLKVWQKDLVDGESRFDIRETDETFGSVYYSYYGNETKTIKVYKIATNMFEVYFKHTHEMMKVCHFLKMLGYNSYDNPIDTTPVSTNYIHINLAQKCAILNNSDKSIKDYPINWSDEKHHIYAYRDVSDIQANTIQIYFRNYKTAKRWLDALEFIGYSVIDCREQS